MKRFYLGLVVIVSFVLMLGGIIYSRRFGNGLLTDASGIFLDGDFQRNKYGEKKHILLKFIKSRLMDSEGGITTNTHRVWEIQTLCRSQQHTYGMRSYKQR